MLPAPLELTGTLRADGTLELDQKPAWPACRVRLVMQPILEAVSSRESLLAFVQRSRRELEAAGSHFMNEGEVNAHIDWLREGDAIDEMLGKAAEENQRQERQ